MATTRTLARPVGNQRIGSLSLSSPTNAVGRWVGNQDQSPFQAGDGSNLWACIGRVRANNNVGTAVFSFVSAESGDSNPGLTAIRCHVNGSGMSAFGSVNVVGIYRIVGGSAGAGGEAPYTFSNAGACLFTVLVKPSSAGAEYRKFQVGVMQPNNAFAFGSETSGDGFRQSAGVPVDFRAASNLGAGTGFRLLGGYSTAATSATYHFRGTSNALTFVVLLAGVTWADVSLDPDTADGVKNWELVNRDPQRIFDFVTPDKGYVVSYGDVCESDGTTRITLDNERTLVGGEKLISTGGHPGSARVLTLEASADTSRRWKAWPDYAPAHRYSGLATSSGYAPESIAINSGNELLISGFVRGTGADFAFMMGLADGITGRLLKPMLPFQPRMPFITNTSFVRGEVVGGIGLGYISAYGDNHVGHGAVLLDNHLLFRTQLHHETQANQPTTGDRALAYNMVTLLSDDGVVTEAPNVRPDAFGEAFSSQAGYMENLPAYPSAYRMANGDEVCQMRVNSTNPARLVVQKRKADGTYENCIINASAGGSLVGGYSNHTLLLPNGHLLANWNVRNATGKNAAKPFCAIVDCNGDISNGNNVYAPMTGQPCNGVGGNPTLGVITTDDDRFNLFGETGESPGTTPSAMKRVGNLRFFGFDPSGTTIAALLSVELDRNPTETADGTMSRFVLVWDYDAATKTMTRIAKSDDLAPIVDPAGGVQDAIKMVGAHSAIMVRTVLNGTTKTDGVHFCDGQNKPVGDAVRIYYWPNVFTHPSTVVDLGIVYDCGNSGSGADGVGGKGVMPKTFGNHAERWKRVAIEVSLDAGQVTIMHGQLRVVDLAPLLAPFESGSGSGGGGGIGLSYDRLSRSA